jgi:hypothetical protein
MTTITRRNHNKAESAATSKKEVDEIGLMAATCFHEIGVRYLNQLGGNERYSHAMRLVEASLLPVCYDVACEFESTVRSYNDEWLNDVSVRIGRFRLYGHQLRCHILYNLLRTEGFGLMVGEEVEQLSYMLQHLIAPSRTTEARLQRHRVMSSTPSSERLCGKGHTSRGRSTLSSQSPWSIWRCRQLINFDIMNPIDCKLSDLFD